MVASYSAAITRIGGDVPLMVPLMPWRNPLPPSRPAVLDQESILLLRAWGLGQPEKADDGKRFWGAGERREAPCQRVVIRSYDQCLFRAVHRVQRDTTIRLGISVVALGSGKLFLRLCVRTGLLNAPL